MNPDPYRALGVRPFINCCSVRTMHGGSLMLPQVREAIDAASRRFVNLDELMEAAGRRIAELTGAEWGIVTCGSAAAVALGTAACVAGNDPVKMVRLPFTDGMVNRAIIPAKQRFAYDQAVRMVGCRIVEIDTREELDRALDEPVALVVLLGKQEHLSAVRLEEIASVCKPRGIPILVDAASEHIERPSPWLRRGADLVVYSGGKFLRGPQTSGLLLGDKGLCQAAWRNGSPHQALGRPMKVSKEDIVGVVAALEYWFGERDEAAERRKWDADLAMIAERFGQIDGVRGEVLEPSGVDKVPRLKIVWDRARFPLDGTGLARQPVLDGEPRVMLDDNSATDDSLAIDPFQLQPGEAAQVGDAIVNALARVADQPAASDPRAGACRRRRVGAAGRLHAWDAHASPRARTERRRHCRAAALGAVRRAGQRRDRFRPYPLGLRGPARGGDDLLSLRGPRRGRRDGRHGAARRRQRPEPGHRQPHAIRRRVLAGAPGWIDRAPGIGDSMNLHIVPTYAAALALLFALLSIYVIRGRGRYQVTIGADGAPDLERRIRVHANFAEYVPFTLLLLTLTELRGAAAGWLHAMCLCLLAGRLLHASGVSRPAENLRFRQAGVALTLTALIGAAITLLV